eukprot:499673_1
MASDKEEADLIPISDCVEPERRIPGVYRIYFRRRADLYHFTQAKIIPESELLKGFDDFAGRLCFVLDFNGREELLSLIQAFPGVYFIRHDAKPIFVGVGPILDTDVSCTIL